MDDDIPTIESTTVTEVAPPMVDPEPTPTDPEPTPTDPAPTTEPPPALLASTPPPVVPPHPGRVFVPRWLAIALALLLVGTVGFAVGWVVTPDDDSTTSSTPSGQAAPVTPAPSTTAPASGTDRSASALPDLGVRQQDLSSSVSLELLPGGNSVERAPTLDLCNGTYPSESKRTARLQLAVTNAAGDATLSTEAVLYANAADAEQAFSELQAAVADCPSSAVPSPVGGTTVATRFNRAPDASWPKVADVDRLAYDFVTTDQSGRSQHSVAVYLRRGRALLAVYFPRPDATLSSIAGQTTIEGIVNVFANRMAQLPASVVN